MRTFTGSLSTRGLWTAFSSIAYMKIDRMKEGSLYEIKPQTIIETSYLAAGKFDLPVMKGWRQWDYSKQRPPFIYLGWKIEDWTYHYQHTNKIHYVLWQENIYIMDNQFAKHIVPVIDEVKNG